jgi:hypothetical protein
MNSKEQVVKCEINTHRRDVEKVMTLMASLFLRRGKLHDVSKLEEPELSAITLIKDMKYGTDEYLKHCQSDGIKAHYKNNRHHPEHFENGVDDMTLIDVMEYFADCAVAAKRRSGCYIDFENLRERHKLCPQLVKILNNTLQAVIIELDKIH